MAHSLSPLLHGAALESLGLSGSYALLDVQPDGLEAIFERIRGGELDGVNVTIPHKERACALVDRLVGPASLVGALNTVVKGADGRLEGHNTDVAGLRDALLARWPRVPFRARPATVIGAGGAARAAVMAADELGASEIRVVNRTHERAEALVDALQGALRADVVAARHPEAFDGSALVLQASSLGMGWQEGTSRWRAAVEMGRDALQVASDDACLLDLVYRPALTPWMQAADQAGLEREGGLGMLGAQAAASFALWTGRTPSLGEMLKGLAEGLD